MSHFVARTRFPFGLIEKGQRFRGEEELLVYPKPLATPTPPVRGRSRGEEAPLQASGNGNEVLGLRDYRAGDEARAIHWRRSANLDRVVVRETAQESRGQLSLVLDQHVSDSPEGEAVLERLVGRAAFLAEWGLAEGMSVEILVRGERSPLVSPSGSVETLWRFLALLERTEDEVAFPASERASHRLEVPAAP